MPSRLPRRHLLETSPSLSRWIRGNHAGCPTTRSSGRCGAGTPTSTWSCCRRRRPRLPHHHPSTPGGAGGPPRRARRRDPGPVGPRSPCSSERAGWPGRGEAPPGVRCRGPRPGDRPLRGDVARSVVHLRAGPGLRAAAGRLESSGYGFGPAIATAIGQWQHLEELMRDTGADLATGSTSRFAPSVRASTAGWGRRDDDHPGPRVRSGEIRRPEGRSGAVAALAQTCYAAAGRHGQFGDLVLRHRRDRRSLARAERPRHRAERTVVGRQADRCRTCTSAQVSAARRECPSCPGGSCSRTGSGPVGSGR